LTGIGRKRNPHTFAFCRTQPTILRQFLLKSLLTISFEIVALIEIVRSIVNAGGNAIMRIISSQFVEPVCPSVQ